MTSWVGVDDVELVKRSAAGDRDAFGELVARYQALVASLAYSATGSLAQSEDLAQETFVTAWRQLASLREPVKLRSWLCGIARNLSNNAVRKQNREPVDRSATLDMATAEPAPELMPADHAITREEEELLWRAVEKIPETYREPLILFYREQQSINAVAEALDLSEDAAKQRLSRGRKLLQEELATFVEGALARTAPGRAFTLGVLAALPAFAASAKAATVLATAAKGSATATSAGALTVLNAALGPILGIAGAYFGVKSSLDAARTPRERAALVRQTKSMVVAVVAFNVALFAFIFIGIPHLPAHPIALGILGALIPISFAFYILISALRTNTQFQSVRAEEIKLHPEAFSPSELKGSFRERKSRATFLGLPLFHYLSGRAPDGRHRAAKGWVAVGDRAYGVLFAAGGVAVGGVAVGGAAAGIIALGGVGFGVLALGGLAVGALALGGGAIGIVAVGGMAIAWKGAIGGMAVARHFALGGAALAEHADDDSAREFANSIRWFDITRPEVRSMFNSLVWMPFLLFLIPIKKAYDARRRR